MPCVNRFHNAGKLAIIKILGCLSQSIASCLGHQRTNGDEFQHFSLGNHKPLIADNVGASSKGFTYRRRLATFPYFTLLYLGTVPSAPSLKAQARYAGYIPVDEAPTHLSGCQSKMIRNDSERVCFKGIPQRYSTQ